MKSNFGKFLFCIVSCGLGIVGCSPEGGSVDSRYREANVEVLGGSLHFQIYDGGETVVLLEAGATYGVNEWTSLAKDLAAKTSATIVSYDRAGMGSSENLDVKFELHHELVRLHAALYELELDDNLLLVGHSFGGYMIQLYSNMYPAEVRGLVYLDSNTIEGLDDFGGAEMVASGFEEYAVQSPTQEQVSNLRLGRGYAASHEMMRRYPVVCGIPIAVVTAGKEAEDGVSSEALFGWREGQRKLARENGAEQFTAKNSGHMVPFDEPEVVLAAINHVLAAMEAKTDSVRLGAPEKGCAIAK